MQINVLMEKHANVVVKMEKECNERNLEDSMNQGNSLNLKCNEEKDKLRSNLLEDQQA